jgi:DNA polymerase III delta subunit
MITLIHGDHIEASREELNRRRSESKAIDIRNLDGRSLDSSTLVQSLESSSLFGGDTLVVVERLFGKLGRQVKKIEELCKLLVASSQTTDILLWEDKEVGATVTKYLGKDARVMVFKLPVLIFQFLDGVKSGNGEMALKIYQDLVSSEAPELVFSMLVKRVRQLIQIADGGTPEGLADWQAGRLTTQAKSFTMEKLLASYKKLHDIEVSIKTGMSPFSVSAHIEQVLVDL